jgi:small GTP-binding protein
MAEPENEMTITVLGKGVVGKTSLVYRFINNHIMEEHDATIEDKYTVFETIDGKEIQINILDTAGEEDYQNMLDQWIEVANGFLLVYSIDDNDTFEVLKDKYNRIKKSDSDNTCPIIIVGNKADLEHKRQVNKEDAMKWANEHHSKYFETSATTGPIEQVKLVFLECAREILRKRRDVIGHHQYTDKDFGNSGSQCNIC